MKKTQSKLSEKLNPRWTWIICNLLIAGILYLLIQICKHYDKGWFYVVNREGFNGYFYAWSITLLAGTISSLLIRYRHSSKDGKKWFNYFIIALFLLVITFVAYLMNSGKVNMDLERFVDSIEIEELRDQNIERKYNNIDKIAESINTEEFIDRIDKEQLKYVLVRYNYKIADPIFHWNILLLSLTAISCAFSFYVFYKMNPKPDD